MKIKPLSLALASIYFASPAVFADISELEAVVVTSDFREQSLASTPASVTVVDDVAIKQKSARGLDDLMSGQANVNASAGASNANYFQVRGIGERSQFQTPLNPSVGVLVDDFDYSRMGAAATMFDVESVEVLRGPQGTAFGSSALAGLVKVKSKEASEETEVHLETTMGSHNTQALGAAVGGALIEDQLFGRLAVYKHTSDGYMENTHLDKTDTQNEDELTVRGNLKWLVTSKLDLDIKVLHLNIDNGYDAFNLDNDYKTDSDQPGHDRLKSNAIAVKSTYQLSDQATMQATVTHSDTTSEYGYDEDWTYQGYDAGSNYIAFDNYKRERKNNSLDIRFLSSPEGRILGGTTDWVVGAYYFFQKETMTRDYDSTYGGADTTYRYDTFNTSLYGQLDHHVSDKTVITTGLRAERFFAYYKNSSNFAEFASETLFGGKLGVTHSVNDENVAFASLSRGYKAGGINDDSTLSKEKQTFDTEYMWSLETGLNSSMLNGDLKTRLVAFYAQRKDQQVNNATQQPDSNPARYIIYLDNATEGTNTGLEAELDWLVSDSFRTKASIGLLDATFDKYTYKDKYGTELKLDGKPQAHAPSYQYSVGGEVYLTNEITLAANIEGKDGFYYSNSHNPRQSSDAYTLLNASVEYALKNWTILAWGRNLQNTEYDTRGFYFGNDPKDGWTAHNYTQKGEPRTFGITVSYDY